MPVDQDGNIRTTRSVNVKTLHDVITIDGKDVFPTLLGGVVRIPKDTADCEAVGLGVEAVTP